MSDSVRPHRRQPTRLPCPWDSPGKNTRVGCHFLLQNMKVKSESEVSQLCATLSDPMDCSPPGSSTHGFSRQEYWSGVNVSYLLEMKMCFLFTRYRIWNVSQLNFINSVNSILSFLSPFNILRTYVCFFLYHLFFLSPVGAVGGINIHDQSSLWFFFYIIFYIIKYSRLGFFFLLCHMACRILVPWPGIKLVPPTVKGWSPNHRTGREFPEYSLLNF